MFWSIAAAALFVAAFITFIPLMRVSSLWKPLALALLFAIPATTFWLYHEVGTPDAIGLVAPKRAAMQQTDPHSSESAQIEEMIAGLEARLSENPEDLDGWMLLARTLKTVQRFPEAMAALETANRLSPDNPAIMVDLVETQMFLSSDGRMTPEMIATLESALDQQPTMQKALWLMGVASSQAGDDAFAISYWQSLLEQLEPGSAVARSVQSQIDRAKTNMGMEVEAEEVVAVEEDDGSWRGIQLKVEAGPEGQSGIPAGGVLYVMVRTPGPVMGPPLGVRRIIDPTLPLELTLTDQDSMLKERLISSETEVQLQARISRTGSPTASPGDWQSTSTVVALNSDQTVELLIDQRVE